MQSQAFFFIIIIIKGVGINHFSQKWLEKKLHKKLLKSSQE
jgi:hypothetical protein